MSEKFKLFNDDEIDRVIIEKKCHKTIDRLKWHPGPWDSEPDHEVWTLNNGLMGMIHRMDHLGHLCGYVGVPRSHPLYELDYDNDLLNGVTTHGGLTYAGHRDDDNLDTEFWYFGFDCAHYSDLSPLSFGPSRDGTYRNWQYVKDNVEDLSEQLYRIGRNR